LFFSWFNK